MENQKLHSKEKHKFALYAPDHVIELARKWYEEDNCASLSEFICKAIEFYAGFVSNKANPNYFPRIVISTLKAIIDSSADRLSGQLYRIAVELAVLSNIDAAANRFKESDVRALRETCEDEVKRINGILCLEKAARWQSQPEEVEVVVEDEDDDED